MTKNFNNLKTDVLKKQVTQLAANRSSNDQYTKMVKVLARRLKSNAKKVRRQARTGFFTQH